MADRSDLGSGALMRVGSSPTWGTKKNNKKKVWKYLVMSDIFLNFALSK